MDLSETCRAAEGRGLLLAGPGGRGLAGEAGGWIAGWMEKEEDYNFFFSSLIDGLAPLAPPTPARSFSGFTRRSRGHCTHTHT